jgi:hypothetical protein
MLTKLLCATLLSLGAIHATVSSSEKEVYICKGGSATKYHLSETYRGLNSCKHKVEKITEVEAKTTYKMTLCGWEG